MPFSQIQQAPGHDFKKVEKNPVIGLRWSTVNIDGSLVNITK